MKSPDFDHIHATTIDHALALLALHGDDARILAGGQTLLATLNMRLSEPHLLIDITGLADLKHIALQQHGSGARLHIGALITHTAIESSGLVAQHAPLLALAAPHIAHRAIRNAGTWGGSIAYGDPAAEWPCCLVALDGMVVVQGPSGQRRIAATDFFKNLYTTDLQPNEIVLGADVPIATPADWFGFDELARRHGDYAVAGLAVALRFDEQGAQNMAHRAADREVRGSVGSGAGEVTSHVRLAYLGIDAIPLRARRTEALMTGKVLDTALIEVAVASLKTELEPMADLTHDSHTKRHLACVLARRLLTTALQQHPGQHAVSI